jgi:hypothetical protein
MLALGFPFRLTPSFLIKILGEKSFIHVILDILREWLDKSSSKRLPAICMSRDKRAW